MAANAEQDAVFQRLMDLGRGFQPDLYDVAGEVVEMLKEAATHPSLPVCPNCESEAYTCGGCGVVMDATVTPQPVVDREALAEAIDPEPARAYSPSLWMAWSKRERSRNTRVDAVLALLNGTAK